MSPTPQISVVMSAYNDAEHLSASIDSVLDQTELDFEFIIVNDGSTDPRVGEILAEYARRDQRIQVISKDNEGLTKALIDGCAAARGEFIARIDVGDVMLPDRLRKQKNLLDCYSSIAFVSCWTEYCGPQWETLYVRQGKDLPKGGLRILPESQDADLLAGPTHHGSVSFRRTAYLAAGGYRAVFYLGQDWDLWYRLAEQGDFSIVPEVLYRVRMFSGALSARYRRLQREIGRYSREAMRRRRLGLSETPVLERAARIRPTASVPGAGRVNEFCVCYFVGEALRRRGDPRAREYLHRAYRLRPWHPIVCARYLQALWTGGSH